MKRILPLVFAALTILLWTAAGDAQQTSAIADGPAAPPPPTVTGSGTINFIPLWTGSTTLGNSKLFQTGGMVGVGTAIFCAASQYQRVEQYGHGPGGVPGDQSTSPASQNAVLVTLPVRDGRACPGSHK
jgi:hypothetical protein